MNEKRNTDSRESMAALFARGLKVLADAPQLLGMTQLSAESEGGEMSGGWLEATVERWRRGATLFRADSLAEHDTIVGRGEWTEVSVALDPLTRQMARSVRFYAGEERLGEVTADGDGCVYLSWLPPGVGLHHVEVEVLTVGGRVLQNRRQRPPIRVQVLPSEPAAIVTASGIFNAPTELLELLEPLLERGIPIIYADSLRKRKPDAIRAEIERLGLPEGALLAVTDYASMNTLGVDFSAVFATIALRRLHASGVAVGMVVGASKTIADACEAEGLISISVPNLGTRRLEEADFEAMEARAEALKRHREAAFDSASARLDVMTGTRASEGNRCRLELDNREARLRIFDAIDGASRSVHLQFYIFEECRFTEELSVRLIRAARRGVSVRLMIDALYSGQEILGSKNRLATALRAEPGLQVLAADPIESTEKVHAQSLKERDHRKLILIDDEVGFVTGRNAGDEYYTGFDEVPVADFTLHERIPWLDAHVEVSGPLVADIAEVFALTWERNDGGPLAPPERPLPVDGGERARFVVHDGVEDANAMAAYEAILDSAASHVIIVNDFPVLASLAAAVRRAVGRGVEVSFLTGNALARRGDGTFFKGPVHRELFEYMTKKRLEPLMDAGVTVYEYVTPPLPMVVARGGVIRPYVHAKIIVADGKVASIGSANLDVTASYWEREAVVITESSDLARTLEAELREMMERSLRIDRASEYWKRETAQRELVSRAWPDSFYS